VAYHNQSQTNNQDQIHSYPNSILIIIIDSKIMELKVIILITLITMDIIVIVIKDYINYRQLILRLIILIRRIKI